MSPIREEQVRERLRTVAFESGKDLVSLGMIDGIRVSERAVSVTLELPSPRNPATSATVAAMREALSTLPGSPPVDVATTWRVREGETRHARIPGVKNLIAVASGKGGVGKTTVAVNLAVGLAHLGASAGLMDLDIYGPNVPLALGSDDPATIEDESVVLPAHAHGVAFLSMAHFAPGGRPVLWRGPMLHKMVQQLSSARWGDLDYLVLDLPPGTGDVQLTVLQNQPLTGAVIVTTPQEIALMDARKGVAMFEQERLPILGVVENMVYYRCRKCGKEHEIFPTSRAPLGESVKRLGRLPIDPALAAGAHGATPLVTTDTNLGRALLDVAVETAAELGRRSLHPNPFRVLA